MEQGKGIVVPEELLRAGAVVSEDERGLCVYVDAEADEEVAELARRFLGGNVVSGISAGVVWYRPLSSEPGLLDLLVGTHDEDIAKAREGQRSSAPNADQVSRCASELCGQLGRVEGFVIHENPEADQEYREYLSRLLDTKETELLRTELAVAQAVIALQRRLLVDGHDAELVDIADELAQAVGL